MTHIFQQNDFIVFFLALNLSLIHYLNAILKTNFEIYINSLCLQTMIRHVYLLVLLVIRFNTTNLT